MNDHSENNTTSKSFSVFASLTLFLVLIGIALLVFFYFFSARPQVTGPPIPSGQAEIHVEFKGLSTDKYNKLNAFVKELAEEHSAFQEGSDSMRDVGDFNSYHGLLNGGFVKQRFTPNLTVSRPGIEKGVTERFETFLRDNGIKRGAEIGLQFAP